jgi:hypothetical protein
MDNIIFIVGAIISVVWGAMVFVMLYSNDDASKK